MAMLAASASAQTLPSPKFSAATIGASTPGAGDGSQIFNGLSWLPTCPAANCPGPADDAHTVVSKSIFNGNSTDAHHPSWLIQGSLYNNAGDADLFAQHVTAYYGMVQGTHAGGGWTLNTDLVRCGALAGWDGTVGSGGGLGADRCFPGSMPTSVASVGYELDFSNWDQDAGIGHGPFTTGLFINTLSSFTSQAGIFFAAGTSQVVPSWDAGIYFGPKSVKSSGIMDASNSIFSYQVLGNHSVAFYDNSTSTYGMQINGTHSGADMWFSDSAPTAIKISNTRTTLIDAGTAFSVSGTGAIVGSTLHTSGTSALGLGTSSGNGLVVLDPSGTLANAIAIQPAPTTFGPAIKATGSDTNIPLLLYSQGTGSVQFRTGNGLALNLLDAGATVANNVAIQSTPTTFGPVVKAMGTDTNIALNLAGKGTGAVQVLAPLVVTGATTLQSTLVLPQTTPASSAVTCTAGAIYADASFIYACTATNTWKRAALAAF